jgi:Fe-S cluster assembly scaffold protein SufB
MKKLFLGLALLSSSLTYASNIVVEKNVDTKIEMNQSISTKGTSEVVISNLAKDSSQETHKVGDCTFKVKGTYQGHTFDVEVTISDVSWVKCAAIKVGIIAAVQ